MSSIPLTTHHKSELVFHSLLLILCVVLYHFATQYKIAVSFDTVIVYYMVLYFAPHGSLPLSIPQGYTTPLVGRCDGLQVFFQAQRKDPPRYRLPPCVLARLISRGHSTPLDGILQLFFRSLVNRMTTGTQTHSFPPFSACLLLSFR